MNGDNIVAFAMLLNAIQEKTAEEIISDLDYAVVPFPLLVQQLHAYVNSPAYVELIFKENFKKNQK